MDTKIKGFININKVNSQGFKLIHVKKENHNVKWISDQHETIINLKILSGHETIDDNALGYEGITTHINDMTCKNNSHCKRKNINHPVTFSRELNDISLENMGGALVFMEPKDTTKPKKDHNVWRILCRGGLYRFT